ncbi:MAG TPA: hypothetical protein VIR77_01480 [Pontiella sp.]
MKETAGRRVVRTTPVASLIFALLVVFELCIIFGALEMDAALVRKHAPWAYEPFLRLVGEHPDQFSRWGIDNSSAENAEAAVPESMSAIASFNPEQLAVTLEAVEPTNSVVEPAVPEESAPVLEPMVPPRDEAETPVEEEVPVG